MIKLLSFDLDKTILDVNSWEVVHSYLGFTKEEDEALMNLYQSGGINNQEWLELILKTWKTRNPGCTPESILANVSLHVKSVFEEVLRILRSKYPDLKIGIISGAPSFVVAHFKDVFGLDFAIADNLIDFQSGTVSMYKDKSGDDKFLILKDVSLEYGYELDECMHVGDGMNDVGIFEATGNGVTFNWCGDKVKEKAKYVISEFSELEQLLDL